MSLKRVLDKLENLGLSHSDALVYIYLAKTGPKKGRDLLKDLGIKKQFLYLSLKKLREKKIVVVNNKTPLIFSAVAFEKVIDLLINIKVEQSKAILETKKELLSRWKSVDWKNNNNS